MTKSGDIIIQNGDGRWLKFSRPRRFFVATDISEISGVLDSVDSEIATGSCVAGFLSYEAASGIDPILETNPPADLPLAWFGVYDTPQVLDSLPPRKAVLQDGLIYDSAKNPQDRSACSTTLGSDVSQLSWKNMVTESEYSALIARIKAYISAGDTYQVNFTIRLNTIFGGNAYALFHRLQESQQSNNAAYVETDDFAICSASPEVFFEIDGDDIQMRPMKGTSRRGCSFADDQNRIQELSESGKNCAENVMIVDMIRNDLGRIAEPGSVHVTSLFDIERYPTVLQMTSTVKAVTHKPFSEVIRALFPCSSITGAPKVRTMQIIRELEDSPRGIYTGTIGYWMPDRQARFNVAIRTVVVDKSKGKAEYGVGGGVVWDSVDSQELDECLAKAEILNTNVESFDILETILWTERDGFYLLKEHIERAANSAQYFGFRFDELCLRRKLEVASGSLGVGEGRLASHPHRVRCLLSRDGSIEIKAVPFVLDGGVRRVGVVPDSCKSNDVFMYHKTTKRKVYESAKSAVSNCDDVLLMNERGEVTESTIANVVVEIDCMFITPPVSSGLLAGTFRSELLKQGEIKEGIVTEDMIRKADSVWLINSVRKWMPVEVACYR